MTRPLHPRLSVVLTLCLAWGFLGLAAFAKGKDAPVLGDVPPPRPAPATAADITSGVKTLAIERVALYAAIGGRLKACSTQLTGSATRICAKRVGLTLFWRSVEVTE